MMAQALGSNSQVHASPGINPIGGLGTCRRILVRHRTVWIGRSFQRTSNPSPCTKQDKTPFHLHTNFLTVKPFPATLEAKTHVNSYTAL